MDGLTQMKKIPTLFARNMETDRLVRDEVTPGCEWVLKGFGIPTRKWDGTCCLIQGGNIFKRRELKKGEAAPEGFIPAQDEADPVTGDMPGWVEVGHGPEDQWHREAFERLFKSSTVPIQEGTYELIGPKINGNPDKHADHGLVRHGMDHLPLSTPRTFTGLKAYLKDHPGIEGIVWHHGDKMAKIKRRDFFKK